MNWGAIGAIGEVIGAIAVFVTLIFLTLQLRQNTISLRKAYRSQIAETVSNVLSVMQEPSFARVMVVAFNDPDALTAEDSVMMGSLVFRLTRIWEDAYFQWLEGDYDKGAWHANRAYMLDVLSHRGLYQFFETRKGWHDERFVAYVDEQIAGHTQQVTLEYVTTSAQESKV